jgi:ketosteroid isomerase-like protein
VALKENHIMNNAEENADIVRRSYEAFNSADMETLTKNFHEDASWHTPGRSPIAGDHHGRDAVFTQFGRYGGETLGTFKATLENVFSSSRMAALLTAGSISSTSTTGTSSGRSNRRNSSCLVQPRA